MNCISCWCLTRRLVCPLAKMVAGAGPKLAASAANLATGPGTSLGVGVGQLGRVSWRFHGDLGRVSGHLHVHPPGKRRGKGWHVCVRSRVC